MKKILAHPFVKSSAIMFVGTMVTNVLAYVYHLVTGRLLGPVGYGELAALLSIFYILNAPSTVMQNILVKFFSMLKAKNDYGQSKRLLKKITWIVLIAEVIICLLLLPFLSSISSFLHIKDQSYLFLLYCMFCVNILNMVNISILQAFQLFLPMSVINMLSGGIRTLSGAAGAMVNVGWTLFAGVATGILGYSMTFIPLKKLLQEKENVITFKPTTAIGYSIPVLIAMVSITALFSQDVIFVKHFFSPAEAGVYSSLSVLGKIIFFASSSLTVVAFPMLAERKELGKKYASIVWISLGTVAIISFGVTLFYYLFPSLVVNLLFGKAFMDAGIYLGSFGLFISFYTLSNLFTSIFLALGKTGVWVLTASAAVIQAGVLIVSHTNLTQVIWNNIFIAGALFFAMLLYYPYAKST